MDFFGERWDAPIVDPPSQQISTPVGEPCMWCEEPIQDGDRGVVMPCVEMVDDAPVARIRPAHMECNLRNSVGGIAHLEKRCRCYGGDATDTDDELPPRVAALMVLDYVVREMRGGKPL